MNWVEKHEQGKIRMNSQEQIETPTPILTSLGIMLQPSGIAITPSPSMRLSARTGTFPRLGDFFK